MTKQKVLPDHSPTDDLRSDLRFHQDLSNRQTGEIADLRRANQKLLQDSNELRERIKQLQQLHHEALVQSARLEGRLERVRHEDLEHSPLVIIEETPSKQERKVHKMDLNSAYMGGQTRAPSAYIEDSVSDRYYGREQVKRKHFLDI